jgi:hypothetical protein
MVHAVINAAPIEISTKRLTVGTELCDVCQASWDLFPGGSIEKFRHSTNTNPLQRSRPAMRASGLWKALESSMSLKWLTLWPIALIVLPRAACRLRSCLNE